MWTEVQWRQKLKIGDTIRVRRNGHIAKISKVIDKPQIVHCLCYHIEPNDPDDLGGHWFFSHQLDLKK